MDSTVEIVPAMAACPVCGAAFNGTTRCLQCGQDRADLDTLLASACAEADAARSAAAAGRYADARLHVRQARERGLDHESLDRLEALCAAASGDWADIVLEDLPEAWAASIEAGETAEAYAAARDAAERADWPSAIAAAERAVDAAPWLMPAHKIRLLALDAAGRGNEAERLRRDLLADVPEEPDLARYRFAPAEAPIRLPANVVPMRPIPARRGYPIWAVAGIAVAGVLVGFALARRTASSRTLPPPGA